MTVIDLNERRQSCMAAESDLALCQCGSGWFVLRGRPTDPQIAENGAVALDVSGRVTGYIGELVCVECGRTWSPSPSAGRF